MKRLSYNYGFRLIFKRLMMLLLACFVDHCVQSPKGRMFHPINMSDCLHKVFLYPSAKRFTSSRTATLAAILTFSKNGSAKSIRNCLHLSSEKWRYANCFPFELLTVTALKPKNPCCSHPSGTFSQKLNGKWMLKREANIPLPLRTWNIVDNSSKLFCLLSWKPNISEIDFYSLSIAQKSLYSHIQVVKVEWEKWWFQTSNEQKWVQFHVQLGISWASLGLVSCFPMISSIKMNQDKSKPVHMMAKTEAYLCMFKLLAGLTLGSQLGGEMECFL